MWRTTRYAENLTHKMGVETGSVALGCNRCWPLKVASASTQRDIQRCVSAYSHFPPLSALRLSSQGSTPLYFASRRGHLSIVSELLKHKPRLRGKTYETDPLAASQTERKAEVSVALLRAGYPVLEKHGGKDVFLYDAYGQTPFHNALILQVRHTHLTAFSQVSVLTPFWCFKFHTLGNTRPSAFAVLSSRPFSLFSCCLCVAGRCDRA